MASTVHDEGGFSGDGAVFANDEFITNKVEMVQNIVKKALWAIWVIVIRVVPDDDVRIGAIIFDEGYLREPFHRVLFVGVWAFHNENLRHAKVTGNGNRGTAHLVRRKVRLPECPHTKNALIALIFVLA